MINLTELTLKADIKELKNKLQAPLSKLERANVLNKIAKREKALKELREKYEDQAL